MTIDSILDGFDKLKVNDEVEVNKKPITFWLPEEYKVKYEMLQGMTKNKFGKLLQEVVKKSIDKIDTKKL